MTFTLYQITLVLKRDLDMVKMYQQTKNEASSSRHSKVIARTGRHTDSMKTLPSYIRGSKNKATAVEFCGIRGYWTQIK